MLSDHNAYRQTMEHLTSLHDDWMHASTGTDATTSQGTFEILPFETLQHIHQNDSMSIPPIHSDITHSPSDTHAMYTKMYQPPTRNGMSPNTTQGKPCSSCNTPEEVAHCIKYGTCISYQKPPGGGNGKGSGSGSGSGKGSGSGGGGGFSRGGFSRGGGGTKAQGASSLGGVPKLGNVPYSAQPAGGSSPTMLILILGGGVLAVYFIWHKLRKSKSEDKEMDKKGD